VNCPYCGKVVHIRLKHKKIEIVKEETDIVFDHTISYMGKNKILWNI